MNSRQIPRPKWNEKTGRWVLSIMVDGRRKQFTSENKRNGKKDVFKRAEKWLSKGTRDDLKVGEAFELYIEDYVKKHGENEQLRQIQSMSRLYILPSLSKVPLDKIRVSDWQAVINDARPQKRGKEQLSKKYLSNLRGVIVSFCKWCLLNEYTERNPSEALYIPNGAPRIGKNILQLSDIEKIFKNRTGLWYERAILLEILTGLRPGEVLGIQRKDYQDGVLYIRRSINTHGSITKGKNANAIRTIELPSEARQIIEEQLEVTKKLRSPWLFCNRIGGQPQQDNVRNTLESLIKRHDLPDVTLYGLRHTFYSHVESYLPDRIIKSIFGHSESTDGHELYGKHTITSEAHEAAEKLSITPLYKIVAQ